MLVLCLIPGLPALQRQASGLIFSQLALRATCVILRVLHWVMGVRTTQFLTLTYGHSSLPLQTCSSTSQLCPSTMLPLSLLSSENFLDSVFEMEQHGETEQSLRDRAVQWSQVRCSVGDLRPTQSPVSSLACSCSQVRLGGLTDTCSWTDTVLEVQLTPAPRFPSVVRRLLPTGSSQWSDGHLFLVPRRRSD